MPEGKKKQSILEAVERIFLRFEDRILPFDHFATRDFALINLQRRAAGRPISFADAQIAAISLRCDFSLATRNTKDFESIEKLDLINPWSV